MANINDEHINITEPAQFLVDNISLFHKGKVLDIAMGGGRNAVYLAELGFEVEGVDISAEAVEAAQKLALEHGVVIKAHVADLEHGYRIIPEQYDLIICFDYLQRSLFKSIKEGVRGGGVIVYETYIVDQAKYGRPKNPDHLLRHNELLEIFKEFRCLRYREGIFPGPRKIKAIASIVAQKIN
jgi:2-polyprenyl-3-methyl-5-hydroxy-6-metoxy-1,4-benzoquinol methylase